MPELAPTVNSSGRTSSRTIRSPARYDDFIRHDTESGTDSNREGGSVILRYKNFNGSTYSNI